MTKNLRTFLDELYEIDPALREHEKDILPLVEQLLKSDPAREPDAAFVSRLRMELNERAAEFAVTSNGFFTWQKMVFALAGATAAVAVFAVVQSPFANRSQEVGTGSPLFSYQVETAGEKAFGDLSGISAPSLQQESGTRAQGGGGGGNPSMAPMADMGVSNDAMMAEGKMIAPYNPVKYTYSLKSELTDLPAMVDVFKHKPVSSNVSLASIASRFNIGNIDLNSFAGASVDSLTFSENKEFGYQVTVDFRNGTLSVNAQWEKWPQSNCQTEACWQAQQVKIGDIPADDILVSIAQKFVEDHGISLENYGAPEVDTQWRVEYDRAADKSNVYIPETLRVIFPLMVDGKVVYDQGGAKTGISVGVHVKHKRVMDVWGIGDRTFVKSSYEGVTDPAVIKAYLDNLGNWPVHIMYAREDGSTTDAKEVNVTLGEPTMSYATFYRSNGNMGEELLIPSLIFPVESSTDANGYYSQTIVVPLAKEVLEDQGSIGRPMPLDMPMMQTDPEAPAVK